MSRVLATYNIKGGVGKTSAAVNLSYLASRDGLRTLLWDLDPQGGSTYLFRVKPKVRGGGDKLVRLKIRRRQADQGHRPPGLDLLPADFSYRHMDLALDRFKTADAAARARARAARGRVRLGVPRLPAEHLARVRERVRGRRRGARPDHPGDAVVAHDRAARRRRRRRPQAEVGVQVLAFFSMVDRRKRLHHEVMERLRAERNDVLERRSPRRPRSSGWASSATRSACSRPGGAPRLAYEALWIEVRRRVGG